MRAPGVGAPRARRRRSGGGAAGSRDALIWHHAARTSRRTCWPRTRGTCWPAWLRGAARRLRIGLRSRSRAPAIPSRRTIPRVAAGSHRDPSFLRFWYPRKPAAARDVALPFQYGNVSRSARFDPPLALTAMALVRLDPDRPPDASCRRSSVGRRGVRRRSRETGPRSLPGQGSIRSSMAAVAPERNPPVYRRRPRRVGRDRGRIRPRLPGAPRGRSARQAGCLLRSDLSVDPPATDRLRRC